MRGSPNTLRHRGGAALCGICGLAALLGCGGALPVLRPAAGAAASVEWLPGVPVEIRSIRTAPGWEPDDAQLLSHFYTAIWVEVRNDTSAGVALEPGRAVLLDVTGTPWLMLDQAQRGSIRRWRPWSWGTWLYSRLFSSRIAAMEERLNREQLRGGPLASGERRRGLLLFKPMPLPACQPARSIDAPAADPPVELRWEAVLESTKTGSAVLRMWLEC
jgi:hypothetical protein